MTRGQPLHEVWHDPGNRFEGRYGHSLFRRGATQLIYDELYDQAIASATGIPWNEVRCLNALAVQFMHNPYNYVQSIQLRRYSITLKKS